MDFQKLLKATLSMTKRPSGKHLRQESPLFSRMQTLVSDRKAELPDRCPPGLNIFFQMGCFLRQPLEHPLKLQLLKTKSSTWCPHIRRGLHRATRADASEAARLPGWLVCGDRDSPLYGVNYAAEHFPFSQRIMGAFIISPFLTEKQLSEAKTSLQERITVMRD